MKPAYSVGGGRLRGVWRVWSCLAAAVLAAALSARASAQSAPRITAENGNEILWLDRFGNAADWHPVEECRTRPSTLQCPWGGPALQLYFEVDHHAGEAKYPVGWPRAHINLQGAERRWQAWDRFEFMVLASTSREKLPKRALVWELGEQRPLFNPTLEFPALDTWEPVSVPVAEIFAKRPALKGGVPRLRFVVSESSYAHDDVVQFHVGGFRLTRSLACEVAELKVATPVIYARQPFIKLQITVVGPPADVKRGVPFTIRSAERVVRREMLPLGRGRQLVECDISELDLAPGDYQLIVFEADKTRRRSVSLRAVEEPWKHP